MDDFSVEGLYTLVRSIGLLDAAEALREIKVDGPLKTLAMRVWRGVVYVYV